jgi:hypothetical protein
MFWKGRFGSLKTIGMGGGARTTRLYCGVTDQFFLETTNISKIERKLNDLWYG